MELVCKNLSLFLKEKGKKCDSPCLSIHAGQEKMQKKIQAIIVI